VEAVEAIELGKDFPGGRRDSSVGLVPRKRSASPIRASLKERIGQPAKKTAGINAVASSSSAPGPSVPQVQVVAVSQSAPAAPPAAPQSESRCIVCSLI
jgi:hypothetical protein